MKEGRYLKNGDKLLANTFWGNSKYEEIQDRYIYFQSITGLRLYQESSCFALFGSKGL